MFGARTGDVGDGTSVGTGISVGDDGGHVVPFGTTTGEVIDGSSVGTGISVGDDTGNLVPSVSALSAAAAAEAS